MTNGFPPSSPSPQDLAFGWLLAALTRPRSPYSLRRPVSFPSPSPAVRSGAGGGSSGPQKSAGIAAASRVISTPTPPVPARELGGKASRSLSRPRRFPFLCKAGRRQSRVRTGVIASFQTDRQTQTASPSRGTSRVKVACVCVCVRNVLSKLQVNTSEHLPRPLFQMTPMEDFCPVVWKGGRPPRLGLP